MGLNNFYFIVQFCVVLLLLATLQLFKARFGRGLTTKFQIFLLLVYSYLFLGFVDWRFCLCVAMETFWTYGCGLLIGCTESKKYRKTIGCAGGVWTSPYSGVF